MQCFPLLPQWLADHYTCIFLHPIPPAKSQVGLCKSEILCHTLLYTEQCEIQLSLLYWVEREFQWQVFVKHMRRTFRKFDGANRTLGYSEFLTLWYCDITRLHLLFTKHMTNNFWFDPEDRENHPYSASIHIYHQNPIKYPSPLSSLICHTAACLSVCLSVRRSISMRPPEQSRERLLNGAWLMAKQTPLSGLDSPALNSPVLSRLEIVEPCL